MARSLAAGGRSPARREPDRPSRLRLWLKRRRGLAKPAALALLGAGALGALALGLYLADPAGRVRAVTESAAEWGIAAGFVVRDFDIEPMRDAEGNTRPLRTEDELIRAALDIGRGDPILGFSPQAARERLETLPWIERAHVERRLPETIHVRIKEREAFAIWQNRGRFAVIDRAGNVVTTDQLGAFVGLPLVVGAGAQEHAADLHDLLAAHDAILSRTQALVRIGERRWNLKLHSGTDVLLPEGHEAPALNRLSELHARHALLDRPLLAIDMRLPDRLVLRPPPAPEPPPQQQRRRSAGNRG
jgi:cell division protein FtsQ